MRIEKIKNVFRRYKYLLIGGGIGLFIGIILLYLLITFPSIWTIDNFWSILLTPLFPIAILLDLFMGCWFFKGFVNLDCMVYPFLVVIFTPLIYSLIGLLIGLLIQKLKKR